MLFAVASDPLELVAGTRLVIWLVLADDLQARKAAVGDEHLQRELPVRFALVVREPPCKRDLSDTKAGRQRYSEALHLEVRQPHAAIAGGRAFAE
jgi:hypothetical protein